MDVHVICCNDSVEFAVIDDEEKAKTKMAELKAAYYERNKWSFRDEAEYKNRCYWHIHTVSGEGVGRTRLVKVSRNKYELDA